MARTVHCVKLGREAEGLDFPPYPGELGKRIYENVSKEAWQAWLRHQTMLVNENRLSLADARARKWLAEQMEQHFFGGGAEMPSGLRSAEAVSARHERRLRSRAIPVPGARRTCPRTSARASSRCRRRPASCRTSSSRSRAGPREFRAFFAYHDALMLRDSGLTKAEREMIVVAVAGANDCLYCFVAHGAILRVYAKNPLVADQVGVNYRKADITPRQRAMLAFALKVSRGEQRDRRRRLRGAARARLRRRGHLGHRQHLGVLLPVEPDGELHRPAAQRRVLSAGPRAEGPMTVPT